MSTSTAAPPSELDHKPRPGPFRRLLLVLGGVILLGALVWIGRAAFYGWQAYQSGQALLALAQQPEMGELDSAQVMLEDLETALSRIEAQVEPLTPLLAPLSGLPGPAAMLGVSPDLLRAGVALSALGADGLGVLAPALATQGSAPALDNLLAAVTERADELGALSDQAAVVADALADIDADQLPYAAAARFAELQAAAISLPAALEVAPALSALLGFERPITYLLLVQNNQELRSTGGFISAVGLLTVDQGRPTDLAFTDSYRIFNESHEYGWAPEPMRRYMGIDLLLLRDANWSPDFPSSAALTGMLYTQDTGNQIDGVVAIDLRAVQLLIGALGEVQVEGASQPVTADNVEDQIKLFFGQPPPKESETFDAWWARRKDFIPAMAGAALQRLEAGDVSYPALGLSVLQGLDEGAIQVWVKDPTTAAALAETGWDGGLQPQAGADYVFYADTNMGYNKVDAVLERTLDYAVDWPADGGPGVATVAMTYRHPVAAPGHICDPAPRYGDDYDEMTARCYFAYARLYAPGGSQLLETSGLEADSVVSERGEKRTQRFGGYFVMQPGTEHTVRFTYELPAEITPADYRLVVQRQAGTDPLPVTLQVGDETHSATVASRQLTWAPGNGE